ncbi:hypothetical protein [Geodermatophilus sp. DSM 44513]|uniref:hypothetical protein n=1 Tax=Geodermatophilus sp. DSM 44513 TaxID=1528104 RepID=UPI001281B2C2|nr:hypothetical protein [Geodermatophilus sp. DSM 44513]WNV76273.1 hypothetical protein RTG05_03110 [Geodermatophilus sp. DSM 44513]
MRSLTSLHGAATAAYALALVVAPGLLVRPSGLPDTAATRTLVRALGARDAVLGAAVAVAPRGRPRELAAAARVLCDVTDAAVFPLAVPGPARAAAVAASAATWGALALAAAVLDRRAGR